MKKIILGLIAMTLCAINLNAQQKSTEPSTDASRWAIYHAEWDEWGHLPYCRGWGLCNYTDCWFCDDGDKRYKGEVKVDLNTKKGFLFVVLDPSEKIQEAAIKEKSSFKVAADINNKNSILHRGDYPFDATIGKYGGYKLNITLK